MDKEVQRAERLPDAGCRISSEKRGFCPAGDRKGFALRKARDLKGFTLIELILATAISAFVVGILSVCFSFALRVWQNTQDAKPDQTFQLADLLKCQLAECDPTPIKFSDGTHPLFTGHPNSIVFVTAHSVKAISQGVAAVVRYIYDPNSKVLSYSELVLDPYHAESIEAFLTGKPSPNKTEIRSYSVDFPEFVLSYAGKESKEFSQSWESTEELPVEVLLRWVGKDSAVHAQICMLNTPFQIEKQKASVAVSAGSGLDR